MLEYLPKYIKVQKNWDRKNEIWNVNIYQTKKKKVSYF